MSADVLRRAATRIQHDVEFGQAHGDGGVLLAVADWLDRAALTSPPDPHGKGEGCSDCESYWLALAVAHAYLGES